MVEPAAFEHEPVSQEEVQQVIKQIRDGTFIVDSNDEEERKSNGSKTPSPRQDHDDWNIVDKSNVPRKAINKNKSFKHRISTRVNAAAFKKKK